MGPRISDVMVPKQPGPGAARRGGGAASGRAADAADMLRCIAAPARTLAIRAAATLSGAAAASHGERRAARANGSQLVPVRHAPAPIVAGRRATPLVRGCATGPRHTG